MSNALNDWKLDEFAAFWDNIEYEEAMLLKYALYYDPEIYPEEDEEEFYEEDDYDPSDEYDY